jgi:hypothetical protein
MSINDYRDTEMYIILQIYFLKQTGFWTICNLNTDSVIK